MKNSAKQTLMGLLLILSIGTLTSNAQSQADHVIGLYLSPNKDGKIAIYKKGQSYYGRLVWGTKNFRDSKNPNPALRQRDVVGAEFMSGFKFSEGEYINGKIYDATSGKTYDCKMWLSGNKLNVRGYMGISLLGRTEVFTRIS